MDKETYNDPNISNAELVNRDTFERLMAKKRHKKIFRRINYILLSVVMCFVFVIICMALFLKIETIEVKGNERYTSEQIAEISGISVGQNLYAIDKKEARTLITTEYPYISEVVIRRTLPSTLVFKISEDKAEYYMEICGEYFILSEKLRVLEKTDIKPDTEENPLTFIKLSDLKRVVVGEIIEFDKEIIFDYVSGFIGILSANEISDHLTEIDISSKYNIYISYEDRFEIYLGDNSETDMKLTFARLMIENFEPDKKGEVDAHDITVGSVILHN